MYFEYIELGKFFEKSCKLNIQNYVHFLKYCVNLMYRIDKLCIFNCLHFEKEDCMAEFELRWKLDRNYLKLLIRLCLILSCRGRKISLSLVKKINWHKFLLSQLIDITVSVITTPISSLQKSRYIACTMLLILNQLW